MQQSVKLGGILKSVRIMKLIELMNGMKHDSTTALGAHSPVQPVKSSCYTCAAVTEAPYLLWGAHSL